MQAIEQALIHQRQAAVAADQHIACRNLQHRREQLLGLREAIQATVITQVGTVVGAEAAGQRGVQPRGEIELLRTRLAARQIELQAVPAQRRVAVLEVGQGGVVGLFDVQHGIAPRRLGVSDRHSRTSARGSHCPVLVKLRVVLTIQIRSWWTYTAA